VIVSRYGEITGLGIQEWQSHPTFNEQSSVEGSRILDVVTISGIPDKAVGRKRRILFNTE
jgi:hypothetical protein